MQPASVKKTPTLNDVMNIWVGWIGRVSPYCHLLDTGETAHADDQILGNMLADETDGRQRAQIIILDRRQPQHQMERYRIRDQTRASKAPKPLPIA